MIPAQLQRPEFRFIKLAAKEKRPVEADWPKSKNYSFDDERLQKHIGAGGNYGVLGGFGDLLIIDFDDAAFQEKHLPLLPETFTVRTGSGKYHSYYICAGAKSHKLLDAEKNTLADIQAAGKQVVGPGSTHPNGSRYIIEKDLPIAPISYAGLRYVFNEHIVEDKARTASVRWPGDSVVAKIKSFGLTRVLQHYGYSADKLQMCRLGHDSKGQHCFSQNGELWYCFHCDRGGDAFSLVMAHDNSDFPTAKIELARMFNVVAEAQKNRIVEGQSERILRMATEYCDAEPFFYDRTGQFWRWQDHSWRPIDEVDLLLHFDKIANDPTTLRSEFISQMLQACKRIGRNKIPAELSGMSVQIGDTVHDLETGRTYKAHPGLFATNALPRKNTDKLATPKIDSLLEQWCPGKTALLKEILAYCMLPAYPIHAIFFLYGPGGNGKGCFFQLITKLIGKHNTAAPELAKLAAPSARFESFRLYRKLAALISETQYDLLRYTATLKSLSGEDLIAYEQKGKHPFEDKNYAKLLIATNSLPGTVDQTLAWGRRAHVIEFSNTFDGTIDCLQGIDEELDALAGQGLQTLRDLLRRRCFTDAGTAEERRTRYNQLSHPVTEFIRERYVVDHEEHVPKWRFREELNRWLSGRGRRPLSDREIASQMEGFEDGRRTYSREGRDSVTWRVWLGLRPKTSPHDYSTAVSGDNDTIDTNDTIPYSPPIKGGEVENGVNHDNPVNLAVSEEVIN